jgi:hypothetical protein
MQAADRDGRLDRGVNGFTRCDRADDRSYSDQAAA